MDMEIARRISLGDNAVLDSVVDEHYDDVFRYLAHLTRHQQDAEDLAQQTFLRAREKASTFRGQGSFRAWLFKLAYREYTHWRRRRAWAVWARPNLVQVVDRGFGEVLEAVWLLDLLEKLHVDQRQAFLLHEIQGFSIEEVSAIVGSPTGTVKSRLHHARAKLRQAWETAQLEVKNELG